MKQNKDLTSAAILGYRLDSSKDSQFIPTSPNWYAFQLGVYFYLKGKSTPNDVRMGRGSIVNVSDMAYKFLFINNNQPIFDRIK